MIKQHKARCLYARYLYESGVSIAEIAVRLDRAPRTARDYIFFGKRYQERDQLYDQVYARRALELRE